MALLLVYLGTGLIVGWQIFHLTLWALWGAPLSPLQFIGLAGALGLDVAGVLALKRKPASTVTALFSSAAAWCFYAPALSVTSQDHQAVFEVGVLLPPALLAVATACAVVQTVILITAKETEPPPV